MIKALKEKEFEAANLLMDKRSNVNVKDKNGNTPWSLASNNGWNKTVFLMLENGQKVNFTNKSTEHRGIDHQSEITILEHVTKLSKEDATQWLHSKGLDIESRNEQGEMPIHLACKYGHSSTAEVLVKIMNDKNPRSFSSERLLFICHQDMVAHQLLNF